MAKERTTVSLEPEVAEYLQADGTNASGLVNKLVEQHMNGGASQEQVLDFRISQVESEIDELEARLERKREEYDELVERKESFEEEQKQERSELLQEAHEHTRFVTLKSADKPMIDSPDHMLQEYADELEMSLDELKATLKDMEETA